MTGGLCVVHLVRVGEPQASLRRLLDSYTEHPAGAEHRLVLLYKGFEEDADALAPYRAAARDVAHEELHVSDEGFDLTAYRTSAERLRAERYCFLNSHSRILVDGWLGFLQAALASDGVGVAGASGSWASQASLARLMLRLPGPYSGLIDRASMTRVLKDLQGATDPQGGDGGVQPSTGPGRARAAAAMLRSVPHAMRLTTAFAPFPAHHLRTNAFIVRHSDFIALDGFAVASKLEAQTVEGGRRGMTRQLAERGLKAVVVDRAGRAYDPEDWPGSATLWQERQQGLMVADNQTELYERGDGDRRVALSRYAWGARAHPDPSTPEGRR